MDTWITGMSRRAHTRQVCACCVALTLGLLFIVGQWRYVKNFLGGPYRASAEDLAAISDPNSASHYFVRVNGTDVIDTGVVEWEIATRNGQEISHSIKSKYWALRLGARYLIVSSPTHPGSNPVGELGSMSSDLRRQLFSKSAEESEAAVLTYPMSLQTAGFREAGYWTLGIGIPILVFVIYRWRRAWVRMQDSSQDPVVRRVESWGDMVTVAGEIERQFNSTRSKWGTIHIGDEYIVDKAFFRFNVFRFHDLLWAYKRVTKRSVNLIPVGKSYDAILVFYGGSIEVPTDESHVNEVLEYAAHKAPWAVFGHSEKLDKIFRKQTREFCAAVEQRRQELARRTV